MPALKRTLLCLRQNEDRLLPALKYKLCEEIDKGLKYTERGN